MSGGLGERVYNHPSLGPKSQVSQWPGGRVGTRCRRSHCLSQPCPTPQSPQHGLPSGDVVLNKTTLMKGTRAFKMEQDSAFVSQ